MRPVKSDRLLGMNVFRDLFTNVRDLVGGKSVSTQKVLKDLKRQAYKKKADAVIAVDLDYSEFSGAGRSMLFLVATGTAVKLKKENDQQESP
ncbi:MAG: YbjQ family protein [Balneolaceae bacterium]|nr:YbjQ family protein [Balneolaceae bacterium]